MARRSLAGLATGGFAGAIGVSVGHALLGTLYGSRALGWAIMGGGIGAAEGLYERSSMTLRRGLMAAAVGGLAGGIPFGLIYSLLSRFSETGSRAVAFALLGACIGVSIGLSEVGFAKVIRFNVESVWLDARKRRVASSEKAGRPLVSRGPVAQAKRNPVAAGPSRPIATNTVGKRQPTGMSACPKCNRPVPGTRPYCVFCKISF